MACYSGKNIKGECPASTPILDLVRFEVTEDPDPQGYGSSDTDGDQSCVAGLRKVSGSITCKVSTSGNTPFGSNIYAGNVTTLNLWESKNVADSKHTFTSVMWGAATVGVDADSGAIVESTVPFQKCGGTYTRPPR